MDIDLTIGGYHIRIKFAEDYQLSNWPLAPFESFIASPSVKPTLEFLVHIVQDLPDFSKKKVLFDACHGLWKLYEGEPNAILEATDTKTGVLRSRSTVTQDFSTVETWLAAPGLLQHRAWTPMHIFNPIIEICLVTKLAREGGFVLHSSGMLLQNEGFVFTGQSGAGKSTLADIFAARGASVLSDERVIIRKIDDSFHIYGTPWVGTSLHAHNRSGMLSKLYYIQHGKETHRVQDMSPMLQTQWILQQCFLPHWDRLAMNRTLETINELIEQIECRHLAFQKKPDIVDFLLEEAHNIPVQTA